MDGIRILPFSSIYRNRRGGLVYPPSVQPVAVILAELFAQALPGAEEMGLDGFDGDLEHHGDLPILEILMDAQSQGAAHLRRHLLDGSRHGFPALPLVSRLRR